LGRTLDSMGRSYIYIYIYSICHILDIQDIG
jgi:hypothetical protein